MDAYMIPTSAAETRNLGWEWIDVIIFSGDAFVDHPSFGTAVIARYLQKAGYRVAVVPQPGWRDDLRDFRKLGIPRLCFAVTSGAMDSMVNHYTAAKRLRHDDAYTPDGVSGRRPDRAVTVYSRIIKRLYPDVPLIIGGVEASLRRLSHYDYWSDSIMPSILVDSGADYLCYGMAERPVLSLVQAIEKGWSRHQMESIPQTVFLKSGTARPDSGGSILLHGYEECFNDGKSFAENFHIIETNANMLSPSTLLEQCDAEHYVQVNPPFPPASTQEMDSFWDLPFTKLPHPRYKGRRIPAYDMIKDSIITHRGCFGGCSFCTIAAHQGKFIQSRSEESILKEVRSLAGSGSFRGNISDLGAPTANMYGMGGKDKEKCSVCRRKSCLFPSFCPNLEHSHARLLELYNKVLSIKRVRHAYIGSGVRYDLFLDEKGFSEPSGREYLRSLLLEHTSGRLKVAPEHTEKKVLDAMGKPSFKIFEVLRREADAINRDEGTHTAIVPYFISSHPGCTMEDMKALSSNKSLKGIWMDQVQDFMPTPMTASSVMFCTGIDPRTMKGIFVEKNPARKKMQKEKFFERHGGHKHDGHK